MEMEKEKTERYRLECFEGPLDLLMHLIQKDELEIFDLALEELSSQLMAKIQEADFFIDEGAEAMWLIASLAHLKSRKLLPCQQGTEIDEEEGDLRMQIMNHLIEYQRYKYAAHFLEKREIDQSSHFCRAPANPLKKNYSLEEVKLSDLKELLSSIIASSKSREMTGALLLGERGLVSEKIVLLKHTI